MVRYLIGSEKDFFKFLESITQQDNVAIITHIDLDGLASAIFLEEILNSRGIEVKDILFLDYRKDLVHHTLENLEGSNISKIFISDISVESLDKREFEMLRTEKEVFLIDHHPLVEGFDYGDNIIKTDSSDCSTFTIYNFMNEEQKKKWKELVCATMISEYSFKKKENFEFLKENCEDEIEEGKLFSSNAGEFADDVGNMLIYLHQDLKKAYKFLKEGNFEEIDKYANEVKGEVSKFVENYFKEAEFFEEQNLYIHEISPRFGVKSKICTIVSNKDRNAIFLVVTRDSDKNFLSISVRSQGSGKDMGKLMMKCVEGLEGASGGGHAPAAAARVMKKDFEIFKKRLLENAR